jgi:hypothetical protein
MLPRAEREPEGGEQDDGERGESARHRFKRRAWGAVGNRSEGRVRGQKEDGEGNRKARSDHDRSHCRHGPRRRRGQQ